MLGDSGYQGVEKRDEFQGSKVSWHVAMRKGLRKQLDISTELGVMKEHYEKSKASIRAKVEHPFRMVIPPQTTALRSRAMRPWPAAVWG